MAFVMRNILGQFSEKGPFVDGLSPKGDGSTSTYGYTDKSGAWAIEPQFLWGAGVFSEGLAAVRRENNKFGYINTQGEWVIEPQFTAAARFRRTTP